MKNRVWIATLAAAIGFVIADGRARLAPLNELTRQGERAIARDTSSVSGFEGAQHRRIAPLLGTDGYQWALQTQQMIREGAARVRHVDYDGPSAGRDVHWSASLHWAAAIAAYVSSRATGRPVRQSVEDVFPWVNTLLFLLLLGALSVIVARRFGPSPAIFVSLAAVATYPVYEFFAAGNFDHHGLAAFAAMGSVLAVIAGGGGWIRQAGPRRAQTGDQSLADWIPEPQTARRWFIAAGVCGGIGLWISAATQIPALIAIGTAALLNLFLFVARDEDRWTVEPRLWRAWGIAGAVTSLVLYVIEYAPSSFALRLEVDHPLHALAWLGAGDLFCRLYTMRMAGRGSGANTGAALLDVTLMLAVPVIMIAVPHSFVLRPSSFVVALHEQYITEFRSLPAQVTGWSVTQWIAGIGVLIPATLVASGLLVFAKRTPAPVRGLLLLTSIPVLVFVGLALREGRWLGVAATLALCTLVVLLTVASRMRAQAPTRLWTPARAFATSGLLTAILLPFPALTFSRWASPQGAYPPTREDLTQVVTRDVAQKLRNRLGNERGVVLSGPTTSTWMTWFGGEKTVGTLYWENEEGLRESARILAAPVADAAAQDSVLSLIRELGITHIVLFSWNSFATEYARLTAGLRSGDALSADAERRINESFGVRLISGDIPLWLRPLPYRVPPIGGNADDWALVLEVDPGQSAALAATRSAQFSLAMNSEETAITQLDATLNVTPGFLPAAITRALIQAANPRRGDFKRSLREIESAMQMSDTLALEDRVSLASLYLTAGDTSKSVSQLRRAIEGASEASIRKLPWDYTAANLLLMARQFSLLDLRPDLMMLAYRLLDPAVRVQLPPPSQR